MLLLKHSQSIGVVNKRDISLRLRYGLLEQHSLRLRNWRHAPLHVSSPLSLTSLSLKVNKMDDQYSSNQDAKVPRVILEAYVFPVHF